LVADLVNNVVWTSILRCFTPFIWGQEIVWMAEECCSSSNVSE